jgi:hypothetical protein
MDTHSESLPNIAFESAQTGTGTVIEPPKHVSLVDLKDMNDANLFTYNKATGRAARKNLSDSFNGLLEAETRFHKRPGQRTDLSTDYPTTWAAIARLAMQTTRQTLANTILGNA